MNKQAAERYGSILTDLFQTSFRQGWIDAGGVNTRFAQAGPDHAHWPYFENPDMFDRLNIEHLLGGG